VFFDVKVPGCLIIELRAAKRLAPIRNLGVGRQQLVRQGIVLGGIQRQNGQHALIGQLHHKSLAGPGALIKSLRARAPKAHF
jgi:hypothetical protein